MICYLVESQVGFKLLIQIWQLLKFVLLFSSQVVHNFRTDEFYASTHPLEAKRLIFSEFATARVSPSGGPLDYHPLIFEKHSLMQRRLETSM